MQDLINDYVYLMDEVANAGSDKRRQEALKDLEDLVDEVRQNGNVFTAEFLDAVVNDALVPVHIRLAG